MVRLANEKLQEGRILHGGIECISRANLIVALNVCHYMTEEEETTFCTCARDNLADGGFLLIGHVNMLFDITTFNKYTVEFIATHVFPSLRSGNPGLLEKLKNLLTYPDLPKSHGSEREIVLQRRVDPFTYPATIERLGFKTCDFTPINSFPLPPLIIEKTPELILLQHKSQISNPTLAKIYSSQFQVLFQKTKGLDIHEPWCSRGKPDYDGKYPLDFNKPDEWEAWVRRMPDAKFRSADEWTMHMQQWFREMPRQ
jgi:hypothetical protein